MNPIRQDNYSVDEQPSEPSGIFTALEDDTDTEQGLDGNDDDDDDEEVTTQMLLTINPNLRCNAKSSFECFNMPLQEPSPSSSKKNDKKK